MRKKHNGFTIVELLITITVIGVISAIAIYAYTQVNTDARNNQRTSRVKIITEALENYYNKNGEYPSCSMLTQSASQVASSVLVGIDPDVLVTPTASGGTTNSITCGALSGTSGPDVFAYVGDGSTSCNTGQACLEYSLQYRNEATGGAIVSNASRHKTQVAASSGTTTLTATPLSNTSIRGNWNTVNNATSYLLQRSTDATFATGVSQTSTILTSWTMSSLVPGTTYYLRVAPIGSTGQGSWSDVASTNTPINAPTGSFSMSASLSGSNATGTATALSCASGTLEYQFRTRGTNTSSDPGTWSSWGSWGTAQSVTIAANQGHQYGFQGHARCRGPSISSSSTADSNVPTVVRAINQPSAPTWLSPSYFKSNVHYNVTYGSSCPTNTTLFNAYFASRDWNNNWYGDYPFGQEDWWTNNTGSNKNVEYWGWYYCKTDFSTSPESINSYNVIVVRP